jgi:hypothetical protein
MATLDGIVHNPYGNAEQVRKGAGRTSTIILKGDRKKRFIISDSSDSVSLLMSPLFRFARACHSLCVLQGHISDVFAVDVGALANPTRKPNLYSEKIQLFSAFPSSEHKGLLQRALSSIPGAFTFSDNHKVYADRAFLFE